MVDTGTVLALDLGGVTGWYTFHSGTGAEHYGYMDFRNTRFSGGGMPFLKFRKFLQSASEMLEVREVYYEEVRRHLGTDAAHAYGGYLSQLTVWAEENGVPYEGVPVQTIKRFATGKGNASKDAVLDAVRGWGYRPHDDNVADAIALGRLQVTGRFPNVPGVNPHE